jgi:hypothetical protein
MNVMGERCNFDKPVSNLARDRALRNWMAMLTGDRAKDRRRWKRYLRILEGFTPKGPTSE